MPIFALVDCNNFFASCERAFNPSLEKKPIVVLSNNDGCIIARSNEAKKLGIPMGAPYYAWRALCQKHRVQVFSSNFELYSNMSQRIMSLLEAYCPDLEIYSIDEAFLSLASNEEREQTAYALALRKVLKIGTGIPVSIGLAPTKTLAKIANHLAKNKTIEGVFNLCNRELQESVLAEFPIENIWGIGKKLKTQLHELNINTAKELRDSNPKIIRRQFSVVLERIIAELQGLSCLPLEAIQASKQIRSSRSFGKPVTALHELEEALSHYTATACSKLRSQGSFARGIHVFLHSNLFSQVDKRYANSASCYFSEPSCDTRKLIHEAKKCLKTIYKPGIFYHKTGLILLDLVPQSYKQRDLFSPPEDKKSPLLMKLADSMNARWGKKALFFCAEGIRREWQVKCDRRSPRYTTSWNELLTIKLAKPKKGVAQKR